MWFYVCIDGFIGATAHFCMVVEAVQTPMASCLGRVDFPFRLPPGVFFVAFCFPSY